MPKLNPDPCSRRSEDLTCFCQVSTTCSLEERTAETRLTFKMLQQHEGRGQEPEVSQVHAAPPGVNQEPRGSNVFCENNISSTVPSALQLPGNPPGSRRVLRFCSLQMWEDKVTGRSTAAGWKQAEGEVLWGRRGEEETAPAIRHLHRTIN